MTNNPFAHGIDNASISRVLFIRPHDGEPAVYRPLIDTQKGLVDHYILGSDCRIFNDYAEIIEQQTAADNNDESYSVGEVIQVVYSVQGMCGVTPIHLGDYGSSGEAQRAIDTVSFDRTDAQRCWEISMAHICEQSSEWLLAYAGKPTQGLLFEVASMGDAVLVIKLIAAPWDSGTLRNIAAMTPDELRQEHKEAGIPGPLIALLHQAALAKVRFLVLDSDASPIKGLPAYDW